MGGSIFSWPAQTKRRKDENAVWDQVEAKDACLRRLKERDFPEDMRALAEASDRFFELGVYYRNPLEVRRNDFFFLETVRLLISPMFPSYCAFVAQIVQHAQFCCQKVGGMRDCSNVNYAYVCV